MIPGELKVKEGNITLNKNGKTIHIMVANSGDISPTHVHPVV